MIRMHRYPTGQTGLAAFCDICQEQINENGYLVWTNDLEDWLVIHQAKCDPGRAYPNSMDLAANIVYLANSAGVDLTEAQEHVRTLDSLGI
jgi:hypothetical protein